MSYTQPALVGGLVMGVLSSLPLVNLGNACCCLWVVSGGLVAAYMLQQNQSAPIAAGDGALVGLLAGIAGAVIGLLISIPVSILLEPMQRAMMQRMLETAGDLPPAFRQFLENYGEDRTSLGLLGGLMIRMAGFIFMLFIGSIFSTLGGLLGAAIFKKKAIIVSEPPAASL